MARPFIYKPELVDTLLAYIKDCPDLIPCIEGWCVQQSLSKSTVDNWLYQQDLDKDKYPRIEELRSILGQLNAVQANVCIQKGATGEIRDKIAALLLGKHGYSQKTDITSGGESIKPSISIG